MKSFDAVVVFVAGFVVDIFVVFLLRESFLRWSHQIYPPASTNSAHTSIHPLPLLLVSYFDSSPSTNLALVMQFSLICRKNVELLKYLTNICQISNMLSFQVDCSRVCEVAVVQRALWGGCLYCPNNNIISLLSKSKNTYQAKLQLLKVAKRNKASLSDETLDSLIATNIQVVVMPKLFIVLVIIIIIMFIAFLLFIVMIITRRTSAKRLLAKPHSGTFSGPGVYWCWCWCWLL